MENLITLFLNKMHSTNHINIKNPFIWSSYSHLFKILRESNPDFLDYVYNNWVEKSTDNEWFFIFHKHMRQTDLFVNTYTCVIPKNNLTEDEEKRYQELKKQWLDSRKFLNNYEWISDEYYRAETQWKIDNRELRNEYATLSNKRLSEEKESIGGHLDMVLWNLIHIDSDDILLNALNEFFGELKINVDA